ncbi:flippase-like domain-containing protein [bacterium]|nr:flippase-like domain-containing protein [bacterium]
MSENNNKKTLYQAVRIISSIGLISIILLKTNFHDLFKVIKTVNPVFLLLAMLFMFCEILLMSLRMHYLLKIKSMKVPFYALIKFNMMGSFVGNFLPTKLGVDGLRTYFLAKYTKQTVHSISLITFDKFLNIIVVTIFATLSFVFAGYYKRFPSFGVLILTMITGIFLVLFLVREKSGIKVKDYLKRKKWSGKIVAFINEFSGSFAQLHYNKHKLLIIFILGIFFQINRIITTYFFARAVNINVDFMYFFLIVPIIMILGMLPFSFAGIGITQFSAVQFFKLVGIQTESSLGFTMIIYFSRIVIAFPGLYFFYKEGMGTLMESVSKIGKQWTKRNESDSE